MELGTTNSRDPFCDELQSTEGTGCIAPGFCMVLAAVRLAMWTALLELCFLSKLQHCFDVWLVR